MSSTVVVPPFTQLQYIFAKIRRLTGSGTSLQIPDVQPTNNPGGLVISLQDYVNSFYLYDLPAEFRSLKLKDKYTFTTVQGQDTYAFDSEHYTTVESPAYCAKKELLLVYDPWTFYGVNFNWQSEVNFAFGNGTAGPYSGSVPTNTNSTTPSSSILPSINNDPTNVNYPAGRVMNILITYNTTTSTRSISDINQNNGTGMLYDLADPNAVQGGVLTNLGTVNYFTGQISLAPSANLFAPVPQGNQIQIQYNPEQLNMPLSIMFYQNQFTLRPVPDQGYTIELIAYRQPTQALNTTAPFGTGEAELNEWWELLAVGAAKKIYEDRLDPDGIVLMDKMLRERYSVAEARTYAQIGPQRVKTIYSDQLTNNYGSGGPFGGSGFP